LQGRVNTLDSSALSRPDTPLRVALERRAVCAQVIMKLQPDTAIEERVAVCQMALGLTALSQGVSFFHAGDDLLRSKSLDRDSYSSGDWFNRLDWSGQDNNFGVRGQWMGI